ncbi:DUF945 domain-containing protein, partial [Pseudomonas syringae pv. tagetis]
MQKTPSAEKSFARSKDVPPLKGESSIGFDRGSRGKRVMDREDMSEVEGPLSVSWIELHGESSG